MNIGINLSITGTIVLNPPASEPAETLGPELVTNGVGGAYIGDFAGSTGFTISGGAWTIGGGAAVANDFEIGYLTVTSPNEALVAGKTYRFTFAVGTGGSGDGAVIVPAAGDTFGTARNTSGTYTEDLVYSGTSGLRLRTAESVNNTTVDNWSVKEVLA